jgi:hypothetical protein
MFGAFGFRLLPWDYGVRNLLRRPARSGMTLFALTLVVLLVLVVVGFIRGLEASLSVSGDPRVVLIHTIGAAENLENSSIKPSKADQVSARPWIQRQPGPSGAGVYCASKEHYMGTQVNAGLDSEGSLGLIRGVTPSALLVRRNVQIVQGDWPRMGEVLVGRLAATKLGRHPDELAIGKTITFEGKAWKISGHFVAMGSALESELWCPLDDLQLAMKREDLSLSLVAVLLASDAEFADVDEYCKERLLDLELQATAETS